MAKFASKAHTALASVAANVTGLTSKQISALVAVYVIPGDHTMTPDGKPFNAVPACSCSKSPITALFVADKSTKIFYANRSASVETQATPAIDAELAELVEQELATA